jgi:hypothetical protein
MTKTRQIPEFKNENEEAAWWDSRPDKALDIFEQAAHGGTLGRGVKGGVKVGHCGGVKVGQ